MASFPVRNLQNQHFQCLREMYLDVKINNFVRGISLIYRQTQTVTYCLSVPIKRGNLGIIWPCWWITILWISREILAVTSLPVLSRRACVLRHARQEKSFFTHVGFHSITIQELAFGVLACREVPLIAIKFKFPERVTIQKFIFEHNRFISTLLYKTHDQLHSHAHIINQKILTMFHPSLR